MEIFSNAEICEVFAKDWTDKPVQYTNPNLQGKDYMSTFEITSSWPERVSDFKRYLIYNNGFIYYNPNEAKCLEKLQANNLEIVVQKKNILALLDFIKVCHCNALKFCIGINAPLGSGGTHVLCTTGSFQSNNPIIDPDLTVDNLLTINGETKHFLNGSIKKPITHQEFLRFVDNFESTITNPDEMLVKGYTIGRKTFQSILTKTEYLGDAVQIRFTFGMSSFSPHSTNGQIICLRMDSPEVTGIHFDFFDANIEPNDPFDCPPRINCRPKG
ncbi:hypothetical protein [Flectobacillus major]|uniref:hypothetical protein n=1 Tax=Flectobacillus major TaxID=103 RepID=UPI00041A9D70|nr:hypothetical protein [Flectobacillus major]